MKYFDIHTHLTFSPLSENIDSIISKCKNTLINDIGTNLLTSKQVVENANKYENIYATIGIHPSDIIDLDVTDTMKQLETLLINNPKKIIAIGETGLDKSKENNTDIEKQKNFFKAHIQLAIKYHLPLMVHVRDAHDDLLEIIKEYSSKLKIIIHFFNGDKELVQKYIKINCFISIPGVVTYKNAQSLREALHFIPTDKLLVETDAP
jgi:TatD DNase family protein